MGKKELITNCCIIFSIILIVYSIGCKKEKESFDIIPEVKPPVLTTSGAKVTSLTTAVCGGNVSDDGGSGIISRGICWSNEPSPSISDSSKTAGTDTGSYSITLNELSPNTLYYIRAFAQNNVGISYGNEVIIKTYTGTVTDMDGNTYYTVTIGSQVWMAENLKTTKYRDGSSIPFVTDSIQWLDLITGAYCYFRNTLYFDTTYGKLYNWYAVNDSRKIAPVGWHVPTNADWITLITNTGGPSVAGGKLKEAHSSYWTSPNTGATNETGFTALPGGGRYDNVFNGHGKYGIWWSSVDSDYNYYFSYYWIMYFNNACVDNTLINKNSGLSVRCVKD